jgi:hypothetical protein
VLKSPAAFVVPGAHGSQAFELTCWSAPHIASSSSSAVLMHVKMAAPGPSAGAHPPPEVLCE